MPAVNRTRGAELAAELSTITSCERVSVSPPDRVAYARDLWVRGLIGVRAGDVAPLPPDVVVWPETTVEVQKIVKWAAERRVPVVPYGAGSGVCGGTLAVRGGIMVDLKRMRRLVRLDEKNLCARFEAGIIGDHLEHELERRGYTLGHFPSSIMCSTLGGWLAARSAGQCSSRYGKIEDMVRSLEIVSGTGTLLETGDPCSQGSDLAQLFVGSEGTLGVITQADLSIHRAPEVRHLRGYNFPRLASGCEAMRRVMQRGLRPAVLRLYDELDTVIARHSTKSRKYHAGDPGSFTAMAESWLALLGLGKQTLPEIRRWFTAQALQRVSLANRLIHDVLPRFGGGCLLVVGVEGERGLADAEWRAVDRELRAAGGKDLGPGPGERWLARRYVVSFMLPKLFDAGAFGDTMEVATSWDRLMELYHTVCVAVAPHAMVMAHFSHAYPEGCSIYFTFSAAVPGGASARAAAERRYDALWHAGLAAAHQAGGTISHHHGVGLLKSPFMIDEHGAALGLLRAVKDVYDPAGIFNPGKLGLEASPSARRMGGVA